MKLRPLALSLALGVALAAGACGSLEDPDRGDVVTIDGALEATPGVVVDQEVRVAFLWFTQRFSNQEGPRYTVAQEARVAPRFPASFTLTLAALPPEAAMVSGEESAIGGLDPAARDMRFALGTVIAYVDSNGNGRLDLLPVDATSSVDRVVAISDRSSIVYVEGAAVALSFLDGELAPGFNVLVSGCPLQDDVTCGLNAEVADISEPLVLTLDDSPRLAGLLCETLASSAVEVVTVDGEGPAPAFDPRNPSDGESGWIGCEPDGTVFRDRCEEVPGTTLCTIAGQSCVHERWGVPDDDAARREWACLIPGWCDDASTVNRCATPGVERLTGIEDQVVSMTQSDQDLFLSTSRPGAIDEPWTLLRVPKAGGEPEPLHTTAAGWGAVVMSADASRVRWAESRFERQPVADAEGQSTLVPVETRGCDVALEALDAPRCVALPSNAVWFVDADGAWFIEDIEGGDPVGGPVRLARRPLDGGADTVVAESGGFFGIVLRDTEVLWIDRADETVRAAGRDGSGVTAVRALPEVGLAGHVLVHADASGLVLADVSTVSEDGAPIFTLYRLPRGGGDATELAVVPSLGPLLAFADDGVYWTVGTGTVQRAAFDTGKTETIATLDGDVGWGGGPCYIAVDDARIFWVHPQGGSLWSALRTPVVGTPRPGSGR